MIVAFGVSICDRCGVIGNDCIEEALYWFGNEALHVYCINETVDDRETRGMDYADCA